MNTQSGGTGGTSILLDGTIRCLAAFDNVFACCVGAQIAVFEVLPKFHRKFSIGLPSHREISRLAADGEHLFALDADGTLWYFLHATGTEWQRFRTGNIHDISLAGRHLYCLQSGKLLAYNLENQLVTNSLPLPKSSRKLKVSPPFLIAFAPSLLWIAVLNSDNIRLIYQNESDFPYPIAATAFGDEIMIADHVAGLIHFRLHGTTLTPSRVDASFLHPYAVALDENGWMAAGESGFRHSASEMPNIRSGSVIDLQPTRHGILAVQSRRVTLLRGSRSLECVEFPGFSYRAQRWGSLLACTTEGGLHLFTARNDSTIALEYVLELPEISFDITLMDRYLLAVTPRALYAVDVGDSRRAKIASQLEGVGEPVSVVVDAKRRAIFWGCGRSIRTVEINEAGGLAMTGEVRLGVYPHALALGGAQLYVAAGPGGLLCCNSDHILCLEAIKGVDYAVDVCANDNQAAIASVKALFSLPHGDSAHVIRIIEGHDISSCVLGNRLIYAEGQTLRSIDFSMSGTNGYSLTTLPYVPRRLALLGSEAIVVGEGGTMIVHLTPKGSDDTN